MHGLSVQVLPMTKIKSVALSGVFAGLALAVMWTGSFIPSMDYALPAMAGMLTLLLVLELNSVWALGVYATAAALSLLLLPVKGVALLYAIFFGYYPALKTLLEGKLPKWLAWICKFATFNAAVISAYWLATKVFNIDLDDFGETFGRYAKAIMLAVGNVAFFIYDYMVLSVFESLYRKRWRKKLHKLMGRTG